MKNVTALSNNLQNNLSPKQANELIHSVDLTPVLIRLVHIDGWSKKSATQAIVQYRNFLYLKKIYGAQHTLPPSYEIDEVWHAHILHTEPYTDFCFKLFGHYLHHQPHLASEASSYTELKTLFEDTQTLYQKEFGTYLYAIKKILFKDRLIRFIKKCFMPWAFTKNAMTL